MNYNALKYTNYLGVYILMENVYVSLAVAIIYFILKAIIDKDEEPDVKRKGIRESIYVGLIVGFVLYTKDYYFTKGFHKAHVFTNEPGF